MPRPPRPLPSSLRDTSFVTSRSGADGTTAGRVRRQDIAHPHRGVAAHGEGLADLALRAAAAVLRQGPAFAFSHSTGAALRGIPLPKGLDIEPLHVSVAAPARAPRGRGIRGHQLRLLDGEVTVAMVLSAASRETVPLPVLRDDRLLLTVAQQLGLADLVAAVDHVRFAPSPWHDATELLSRIPERLRGAAKLRRAVSLSAAGVRSRPETLVRLAVRASGLPEPVVGHEITSTAWAAVPDLAWPQFGVLVEYEGKRHRTDARRFASDLRRFDRYLDAGWSPIRATQDDLFRDPDELLARIEHRLRRKGWQPPRRWVRRSVAPFVP